MKLKAQRLLIIMVCLLICAGFGVLLLCYATPMDDLSLNLSLALEDGMSVEDWDDKGWTVFVQEGDTVTELEPNGFGGYTGLELGQTFYFSRLLDEDLDDPTLQLGTVDRNFSIFLDGELIYTDCPEEDNRIGYLHLPMNSYQRTENLIVTLPSNYQGKVLTIAQSFPEWSETSTVRAYPCSVKLYCGYAYESGLIAETAQVSFLCFGLFLMGVLLTAAFFHSRNAGVLCIAIAAFLSMTRILTDASFFTNYFGTGPLRYVQLTTYLLAWVLLLALSLQAEKGRKPMLGLTAVLGLSLLVSLWLRMQNEEFTMGLQFTLAATVPEWIATVGMVAALVLSIAFWRKENSFFRLFTPLALAGEVLAWVYTLVTEKDLAAQLAAILSGGQVTMIYTRLLYPLLIAALVTALVEALRAWLSRQTEKRLMEQQQELAQASYENLRRHQEEVMMLRHDMLRHFNTLRDMSGEDAVVAYLTDLIGRNEKIRPVVQSGNKMLDIILNGRLSEAIDAGIRVEILKAEAPEALPLGDADREEARYRVRVILPLA